MREFDERNHSRYQCLGEARIQAIAKQAESWGKVLNISVAGCLVGFASPAALLAGDDVEMTILIGQTTLRMRGWVVPDANDQRRIGFLFATMSPQTRTGLNCLVDRLQDAQPA